MLQFAKFYEKCFLEYKQNREHCCPVELFSLIAEQRKKLARKNPLYFLDRLLWTEKQELIDVPGFDENLKREIVLGLHLKNTIFGTYKTTIKLLRPLIEEINRSENRPARLLEIGSGSGQLSFAIYRELKKTNLQFALTGSDIVPTYLSHANEEAEHKNIPVQFKLIDAFHLEKLEENSYDIVFCLHSLHHFSPGALFRIMAGSKKIATSAFLGVDGYRGIFNLLFMMISGGIKSLFSLQYAFFHDSFVSGRKMYTAKQLELLSQLSCPESAVTARNLKPGLTMVMVRHKM
jgi:SAM-dependent methyltransferase